MHFATLSSWGSKTSGFQMGCQNQFLTMDNGLFFDLCHQLGGVLLIQWVDNDL